MTEARFVTSAGGTVTVAVGAAGSFASLRVADTGPGLPDDELPHVFDRFWRGSAASRASGSGIGLAVVAELVRAHRGQVEATNEAAGGACFTVLIPLP